MKTKIMAAIALIFSFVFTVSAYSGDVDAHFGPEGQEPTHTLTGNLEHAEDQLAFVADDLKKSNEVFSELSKATQNRLAPHIEATLVSRIDQSKITVKLVLVVYQGTMLYVAELADGKNLIWEKPNP